MTFDENPSKGYGPENLSEGIANGEHCERCKRTAADSIR